MIQTTPFLGELIGTMVLILLGNGVVANVVLNKTKGNNGGWIVITAGWGLAVMAAVFTATALGSPGAHINPAVTLAFAVLQGDYSLLATFIPAQILGAMIGATLVWIQYYSHWEATDDPGAKLACFATGPAIRSAIPNFLSEFIATGVLILGIVAIGNTNITSADQGGIPPAIGPYIVGMLVWSIGLSLGGTTGYAINPARDLGPRIAHALLPIAKKGPSDWAYAWVPVLAPLLGAAIFGFILRLFSF